MTRQRLSTGMLCLAVASGYPAAAGAQDSSSLALPGQPFQVSGGAKVPTQPAGGAQGEGGSLGGHFSSSSNLLRTYTDNMYYASDSQPKITAWGWALQPHLKYSDDLPRLQLQGFADATLASYNTPGQHDDYADVKLIAAAHWRPLLRDHINFEAGYALNHDPFGTSRTESSTASPTAPDKWSLLTAGADWEHGSTVEGFAVEGKAGYIDKTYINNKVATKYENYRQYHGEGLVYYAITPKTQVLVDLDAARSDQPNPLPNFPNQSGMQYEARAGARWFATAKTFGEFRVGMLRREFDHNSQPAFTGVSWNASVTWQASPYRLFNLETGQRSDQSYIAQAGFIDTRYIQPSWSENWTERFYTRLVGDYVKSRFINAGRTDDSYFGALFVNYELARDLTLFGIGGFGRRDSNDGSADYSRADAFIGVKYVFFNYAS